MNLNHRITTALVGIFLARPGPEEPGVVKSNYENTEKKRSVAAERMN